MRSRLLVLRVISHHNVNNTAGFLRGLPFSIYIKWKGVLLTWNMKKLKRLSPLLTQAISFQLMTSGFSGNRTYLVTTSSVKS
ncbi:hypothetical protein ACEQPO_13575 [Bacillus sp. SL00103]